MAEKSDYDQIMIANGKVPGPAAPKKALSLAACERMLRERLGSESPALITLRRHAGAGHLDGCVAPSLGAKAGSSSRTRYVPDLILAYYASRIGQQGPQAGEGGSVGTTSPGNPGAAADLARLQTAVAAMTKAQAEATAALAVLTERVNALGNQVRDLNAVRATLMAKYDAAAAAASERAERLEQENRSLRRSEDPHARVLAQIQMGLQRVLERLPVPD